MYWNGRELHRTAVIKQNLNPEWKGAEGKGERVELLRRRGAEAGPSAEELVIEVWDKDIGTADDFLGGLRLTEDALVKALGTGGEVTAMLDDTMALDHGTSALSKKRTAARNAARGKISGELSVHLAASWVTAVSSLRATFGSGGSGARQQTALSCRWLRAPKLGARSLSHNRVENESCFPTHPTIFFESASQPPTNSTADGTLAVEAVEDALLPHTTILADAFAQVGRSQVPTLVEDDDIGAVLRSADLPISAQAASGSTMLDHVDNAKHAVQQQKHRQLSEEQERRQQAATKVQASVRARSSMKFVREKREQNHAAIKVQGSFRVRNSLKIVQEKREAVAKAEAIAAIAAAAEAEEAAYTSPTHKHHHNHHHLTGSARRKAERAEKARLKAQKKAAKAAAAEAERFASADFVLDIVSAAGLAKADKFGKSDPYCVVTWCGVECHRTAVIKKTLDPKWTSESVPLLLPAEGAASLCIDCFDEDLVGSDDFLGQVLLSEEDVRTLASTREPGIFALAPREGAKKKKELKFVKGALTLIVRRGVNNLDDDYDEDDFDDGIDDSAAAFTTAAQSKADATTEDGNEFASAEQRALQEQKAAVMLQGTVRMRNSKRIVKEKRHQKIAQEDRAAVKLQSSVRARNGKRVARERRERHQAATTVQGSVRMRNGRRVAQERREQHRAATTVQGSVRMRNSKKAVQEKREQHHAATKLQSSVRVHKSKKIAQQKRAAVEAAKVAEAEEAAYTSPTHKHHHNHHHLTGSARRKAERAEKARLKAQKKAAKAAAAEAERFASADFVLDIVSAAGLAKADKFGKSDPYCVVTWCGVECHRTAVIKKTLDPKWTSESVPLLLPAEGAASLCIDCFDEDLVGSDDFLGQVLLSEEDVRTLASTREPGIFALAPREGAKKKKELKFVKGTLTLALLSNTTDEIDDYDDEFEDDGTHEHDEAVASDESLAYSHKFDTSDDGIEEEMASSTQIEAGEQPNERCASAIQMAFANYDRDGDGCIDKDEFAALCADVNGSSFSAEELVGLFRAMDADGDGLIQFEEFAGWWASSDGAPDAVPVEEGGQQQQQQQQQLQSGSLNSTLRGDELRETEARARHFISMKCLLHVAMVQYSAATRQQQMKVKALANAGFTEKDLVELLATALDPLPPLFANGQLPPPIVTQTKRRNLVTTVHGERGGIGSGSVAVSLRACCDVVLHLQVSCARAFTICRNRFISDACHSMQ